MAFGPLSPAQASNNAGPVQTTKSNKAATGNSRLAEQSTETRSGGEGKQGPVKVARATPVVEPLAAEQIKDAIELVRKKRFDEAGLVAKSFSSPVARDLIEWMILRNGNFDADFNRLATFATAHPDWPGSDAIRSRAETMLLTSGLGDDGVVAFFKSRKPASAAGEFALAIAHLGRGEKAKAQAIASRAWREREFSESVEKIVLDKLKPVLTTSDHRARLVRQIYDRETDSVLRTAELLGPDRQALAKSAVAYHRRAKDIVTPYRAVPEDLRNAPALQYARARYWRMRRNNDRARMVLIDMLEGEPDLTYPDKWWFEQRAQTYDALSDGKVKEAYNLVKNNTLAKGNGFADVEFLAGFICATRLKDNERALMHFKRIYDGAETDGDRAMSDYWSGRTLVALGRASEAKPLFERAAKQSRTFYGQLANDALERAPAPVNFSQTPSASEADKQALNGNDQARIIRLLHELNESDLMWRFIRALAGSLEDKGQLAALAELTWALGKPHLAVRAAKVALWRGIDLGGHLYPKNALPEFTDLTPAVDKAFLLGLARQESEFNGEAISHAGARGVMQLMPATARMVARQHKQKYSRTKLTADPGYNVMLGSAHLNDLLKIYNGSYIMTAAGYNAGPGNVRKWVRAFGDPRKPGVDPLVWVENIPYNETRNYVKNVLKNAAVYRTRLGVKLRTLSSDLAAGATK